MKPEYKRWITENYPTQDKAYGKCAEATTDMQKVFTELKRVRGHYYCAAWGEREHWWLVTEDGEIVDPTAIQFPTQGLGEYEEWDESRPEPIGMCPNCGGYIFDNRFGGVCSENCAIEYRAYINSCC